MTAREPLRRASRASLWLPVIGVCALIFTLSSFSQLPSPPSGITDKHEHFTIYFILGLTLVRALAGGRRSGVTFRVLLIAALLTSLYGVTDEIHQMFVPGRDSSVLDWSADTTGAIAAAVTALGWAIIRPRRAKSA